MMFLSNQLASLENKERLLNSWNIFFLSAIFKNLNEVDTGRVLRFQEKIEIYLFLLFSYKIRPCTKSFQTPPSYHQAQWRATLESFHQTWRAGTMKTERRITKAATICERSALLSDIWIEWRGPRVFFFKARYRYQMVYSLFSKLAWGHFSLDASTLSFISLCHSGIDRLSCLDVSPQRVCSIATLTSTIGLNHWFCELLPVSFVH